MATRGPSFRFAPPRAKDAPPQPVATSRLPTRSNNTAPPGSEPAPTPGAPAKTGIRTPAKLRRRNMPGDIRTQDVAADSSNDLRLDTAIDSAVQFNTQLASTPNSATSVSKTARSPLPPQTPDTVACIVSPDPSLTPSTSNPSRSGLRFRTLRRKPSVIGSFMSAQRNITSSGNDSTLTGPVGANSPSDQPQAHTGPIEQHSHFGPPLAQPPSRPATAGTDYYGPYHTPTPLSEPSTTPSLRHTESSSIFSRATTATPTSQTSYSPMISQSPHFGPGAWSSPRKPPRDQNLAGFQGPNSLTANNNGSEDKDLGHSKTHHPVRTIPELAHLATEPIPSYTSPRKAPARPSRDGTPTLDTSEFTPVVFSDLPPRKPSHHRRQSSSSVPDSISKGNQPSPPKVPAKPAQVEGTATTAVITSIAPVENTLSTVNSRSALSSPSLSDSTKSHSRFGFFSRKSKPTTPDEGASKLPKKGPMAGTGHEGYGKYAPTTRSGIPAPPNGSVSRSTSKSAKAKPPPLNHGAQSGSAAGNSTSDEFLAQRTAPVYLRGSGESKADGNAPGQIIRSDSSSSIAEDDIGRNSTVSSAQTSSGSYSSMEPARLSLKASAIPTSAATSVSSRGAASRGRGSWGSTAKGPDRAMSRERTNRAVHTNKNVNEEALSKARQQAAEAASQSRIPNDTKGKKSNWSIFSKSPQKTKTPAAKWNPFQRSQSLPPSREGQVTSRADDMTPMPPPPPPRAIAHYEVLDQTDNNENRLDLWELKDMMDEADGFQSEHQSDADDMRPGLALSGDDNTREKSMIYNETAQILASHLKLSPELYEERAENGSEQDIPISERLPTQDLGSSRPSRLAQVGRIPKVVSTREVQPKIPAKSFSRPLCAPPKLNVMPPDILSIQTGSSASLASQPVQDSPSDLALSRSTTQDYEQNPATSARDLRNVSPEFFSMRGHNGHNSDNSYSSSSGTFYFPSAALTAIIPQAGSPATEDEVWNEYNDLIENVLTPVGSETAKATALKGPRKVINHKTQDREGVQEISSASKTEFPKLSDMASTLRPDLSPFVGTQRRSEVFSGFELPEASPAESCFDCSEEEEEEDAEGEETITLRSKGYTSLNTGAGADQWTQAENEDGGSKGKNGDNDANWMKLTPKSMANLRFGALMTSKWLSFGRVLFSPAHYDLVSSSDDRVLVIDGLGTDWSYFTALTYPNLTIYSLGPGPSQATANRQTQGPWQPLANHRHFSHNDITGNFPFPKNFFAVVVFRFPTTTTEVRMRMALSECKRVLQPGGYIEVSSLDLDLTNMGNKARRAVRALKTTMQQTVPDVCLKPASDNIQCLLGRRGFENLSRCVVGVPAAGVIGDSKTNSRDEQEMSFTKLVEDQTQAGDEVMTKMVAKVGRWWYLKTYEMCTLPVGDVSRSIWNDMSLLRECEKHETAFKLFVCYAQKPTLAKRRTVSL